MVSGSGVGGSAGNKGTWGLGPVLPIPPRGPNLSPHHAVACVGSLEALGHLGAIPLTFVKPLLLPLLLGTPHICLREKGSQVWEVYFKV